MSIRENYKHTLCASFIGYIVQAVVNNFAPLLFLTFHKTFGIPLSRITILITLNFVVQLTVDFLSAYLLEIIGYRKAIVGAQLCAAAGLAGLGIFPEIFSNPFAGLIVAVILYAIGGGTLEVLVSPLVEACPTKNKEATMGLLHSFYCWGQVLVVLASTVFFAVAGIENWRFLACIWAVLPAVNGIYFLFVPIKSLNEGGEVISHKELFRNKYFWLFILLMFAAGASELSMSQWASTFAEMGLGVSKTFGDLLGPCAFAVFMGLARVLYAKKTDSKTIGKFMFFSGVLCVISYITAGVTPNPMIGLFSCMLCGFSVGVMWPGTYSLAMVNIKNGGTAMFAYFALAGDIGCTAGPTIVGGISAALGNNLQTGLLFAAAFPVILLISLLMSGKKEKKTVDF